VVEPPDAEELGDGDPLEGDPLSAPQATKPGE
jgi:hypothetical protein